MMSVQRHQIHITCGSCLQPWEEQHRCPVPPEINFARYTDGALERLAAHLALVLKGRKEHAPVRETA